jgi:preprotein translocase subunit SecD
MKTILYSLIAILLFGSLAPVIKGGKDNTKTIFVEATVRNVSSETLGNSVTILNNRLHLYFNSTDAVARLVPGKKKIEVVFPESADSGIVESLVTRKGEIGFYEVYDHNEMVELLNGNDELFSMMKTDSTDNKSGRLGCVKVGEKARINAYLKTLDTGNKCRFAWTGNPENTQTCLLPLKTDKNNPVIKGSDIESSQFKEDRILISMTGQASAGWAETTRRDLGKSIAILLDDNVLSFPRVRSVIEGGKIEITGSFSGSFGRYVAAMISSGELPAEFHIVK